MFARAQHHFTFIEMSSAPRGGAEACSPACIHRLPGISARPRAGAPSPVAPGEVTRTRAQGSAGESRVSSPGRRLEALSLPVET